MNPFDLKSALLARHAQHVVLIHFPIALFLAGVAFDFVGQWRRNTNFAMVAYYNITLAAVTALPVVATGLMAWRWQLEGQRLKGILLQHLVLGVAAGAMICLVWSIHFYARRHGRTPSIYRLPMEAIAAVLIALTAHLGGFLSGVNAQV